MSAADSFAGFLDDASALDGAVLAASSPVVGLRLVHDTALPLLRGSIDPLGVVVTGGAGQVAGPVALCERLGLSLARLELTARDPGDPVGAVRRLVAVAADLPESLEVRVALPGSSHDPSWLAAADEVAMAGWSLTLFAGERTLADIDAALDRELAFGIRGASPSDLRELLSVTRQLFDGVPVSLEAALSDEDVARGRRWLRSVWVEDVDAAVEALS